MLAPVSFCLLLAALGTANAVNVYLSPAQPFFSSTLSPEDASAAVSRHLGLEAFEPFRDASSYTSYDEDESFVGQGGRHAVLVTIEEGDIPAVLPYSLRPAFLLDTPPETPIHTLSSVIHAYLHRASHSFGSLFSSSKISQLDHVHTLSAFFEDADEPSFAALDLAGLRELRERHSKEDYVRIGRELHAFLEKVVDDDRFTLAVFTYSSPAAISVMKRSPVAQQSQAPLPTTAPPQQPIGAISTCFASLDACNDGTNSCSGRGQCVKASKGSHQCFVCTCGATTTGEGKDVKTDYWAGEKCERKDISGPFVLLTGTVVIIILLIAGSISLLYTIGDQPLPSTLLATAVNPKKD